MEGYDDILGKLTNTLGQTRNTIQNTVQDSYKQVQKTYGTMGMLQKILLIGGIIILIIIIVVIIYLIYRQRKREDFSSQPLFMTEIANNRPHNAKQVYIYRGENRRPTSYIPNYLLQEKSGNQNTYSFWIMIDGKQWNYHFGEWKHIFHRGTDPRIPEDDNIGGQMRDITKLSRQIPGFWLAPAINKLVCVYTTVRGGEIIEEKLEIDDIELSKWVNLTVTLNIDNVALYRNGKLEKIINLRGKIVADKSNIYINYYGGFAGNMCYLQYFDRVLAPSEINKLYNNFGKKIQKYVKYVIRKEFSRGRDERDEEIGEDIITMFPSKKIQDE